MKKINVHITSLLFLVFLIGKPVVAQNYTWMKGSNTIDQPGIYGTIGVAAAANTPGGREIAASWKDAAGDLWLFGGDGIDITGNQGMLNDLWKYNLANNQWTWMKGNNTSDALGVYGTLGVAAAANKPGAREGAVTWTDASGNLWLFGGQGYGSTAYVDALNDLWKYNVSTNQWTWISGGSTPNQGPNYGTMGVAAASNMPGGRALSSGWKDASGNLWLFAGVGYDANSSTVTSFLNELWKYNIATNQWTWINGSNTGDQNGDYGTMGVAATTNMPGGRYLPTTWTDGSGNVWVLGGDSYDATSSFDDFINDLWKYNITTNQWTWMGGNDYFGAGGIYGTINVPSASNMPGARFASVSWTDAAGNLLLCGGYGVDMVGGAEMLNDLWKYNVVTNEWTWLKGNNIGSPVGNYGTQGVATASTTPGGRAGAVGWKDGSGNLWIFGGSGDDGSSFGEFNDLWKYNMCSGSITVTVATTNTLICSGGSATLTANGANAYLWSNNQTGAVNVITLTATGSQTITCFPADANGCPGTPATTNFSVQPLPVINVVPSKTLMCNGNTEVLNVNGANSFTCVGSNGFTATTTALQFNINPTVTTTFSVTGAGTNGCKATTVYTQLVNACTGIGETDKTTFSYNVYPNPNNGAFTISGVQFGPGTQLVVFNALGQKVLDENLSSEQVTVQTQLQKGVYYYTVLHNNKNVSAGKIMIE